jgi:hypothetical protein
MAALCISCGITDSPSPTTTQDQLALKPRSLMVAQDQAVGHKSPLARFSGSCRIKQNASFARMRIYKLLAAPLKVNRVN